MRNKLWLVPVCMLLVAALACGGTTNGGATPANGGDDTRATDEPVGPKALLQDDFSKTSSGWSTDESDESSVQYSGGEFVITLNETEWFAWGTAGESDLENIHVEVTASEAEGSGEEGSFGVMCYYADSDNYYYAGISSDGYYFIAEDIAGTDTTLTDGTDGGFDTGAASYLIGVDCQTDNLVLYVDGKEVASAAPSEALEPGDVALFGWSLDATPVEVHYDDISVTALE